MKNPENLTLRDKKLLDQSYVSLLSRLGRHAPLFAPSIKFGAPLHIEQTRSGALGIAHGPLLKKCIELKQLGRGRRLFEFFDATLGGGKRG